MSMTAFPLEQNIPAFVAIALAHLIAGAALGRWFRFGALLPAFAIVLVESLIGDFRFGLGAWYALLLGGVVLVQIGYAMAARLTAVTRAESRPTDPPAPKSMHAPVRD
jgi:hypothetical protein